MPLEQGLVGLIVLDQWPTVSDWWFDGYDPLSWVNLVPQVWEIFSHASGDGLYKHVMGPSKKRKTESLYEQGM